MNNGLFPVIVGFDERVAPAKFIARMLQTQRRSRFRLCVGDHFLGLHTELYRRDRKARSITVVVKAGSRP